MAIQHLLYNIFCPRYWVIVKVVIGFEVRFSATYNVRCRVEVYKNSCILE